MANLLSAGALNALLEIRRQVAGIEKGADVAFTPSEELPALFTRAGSVTVTGRRRGRGRGGRGRRSTGGVRSGTAATRSRRPVRHSASSSDVKSRQPSSRHPAPGMVVLPGLPRRGWGGADENHGRRPPTPTSLRPQEILTPVEVEVSNAAPAPPPALAGDLDVDTSSLVRTDAKPLPSVWAAADAATSVLAEKLTPRVRRASVAHLTALADASKAHQRSSMDAQHDVIAAVTSGLPKTLLFRHGFESRLRARPGDAHFLRGFLTQTLNRLMLSNLHSAVSKWRDVVWFMHCKDHEAEVAVVQAAYRAYRKRVQLMAIYAAYNNWAQSRTDAAVRLQCWVRSCIARDRAVLLRKENAAAAVIQKATRAHQWKLGVAIRVGMRIKRFLGAVALQALWRGWYCRRRLAIQAAIRGAEDLLETQRQIVAAKREQLRREGAAVILQLWLVRCHRRQMAIRARAVRHRTLVCKIQAVFRMFVIHIAAKRAHEAWLVEHADEIWGATGFQRVYRGMAARRRVAALRRNVDAELGVEGVAARRSDALAWTKAWRRTQALRACAARRIQQAWGKHIVRIRFRRATLDTAATAVQTMCRGWLARRHTALLRQQTKAALFMQTRWRAWRATQHVFVRRMTTAQRDGATRMLQATWRGTRVRLANTLDVRRARREAHHANLAMFEGLLAWRRDRTRRLVLAGHGPQEFLLDLYNHYAVGGLSIKRTVPRLDYSRVRHMLKDCPGAISAAFPETAVMSVFQAIRPNLTEGLSFVEFKVLCVHLANAWSAAYPPPAPGTDTVSRFVAAVLEEGLGGKQVHLRRRVMDKVDAEVLAAVASIQRSYRCWVFRSQLAAGRTWFQRYAALHHTTEAAVKVQRFVRARRVRRQVVHGIARKLMVVEDPTTGSVFYVNTACGARVWTLPRFVTPEDLAVCMRTASPETELVPLCDHCPAFAEQHCLQCRRVMCAACRRVHHRKGARAGHTITTLRRCSQCNYQVASLACLRCGVDYCDSCFKNCHRLFSKPGAAAVADTATEHEDVAPQLSSVATRLKDRQDAYRVRVAWQDHKTARILQPCVECEDATAKVWCGSCDDAFCVPCFLAVHSHGRSIPYHNPNLLTYYRVEDHVKRRAAQLDAASAGDAMEAFRLRPRTSAEDRQAAYERQVELEAAVRRAQRAYRTHLATREHRAELVAHRAEAARKDARRVADEAVRRSLGYKLRRQLGLTQPLESDTPYVRETAKLSALRRPPEGKYLGIVAADPNGTYLRPRSRLLHPVRETDRLRIGALVFDVVASFQRILSSTCIPISPNVPHDFDPVALGGAQLLNPFQREVVRAGIAARKSQLAARRRAQLVLRRKQVRREREASGRAEPLPPEKAAVFEAEEAEALAHLRANKEVVFTFEDLPVFLLPPLTAVSRLRRKVMNKAKDAVIAVVEDFRKRAVASNQMSQIARQMASNKLNQRGGLLAARAAMVAQGRSSGLDGPPSPVASVTSNDSASTCVSIALDGDYDYDGDVAAAADRVEEREREVFASLVDKIRAADGGKETALDARGRISGITTRAEYDRFKRQLVRAEKKLRAAEEEDLSEWLSADGVMFVNRITDETLDRDPREGVEAARQIREAHLGTVLKEAAKHLKAVVKRNVRAGIEAEEGAR